MMEIESRQNTIDVKFPIPKVHRRKRVAEVRVTLPTEDSLQPPGASVVFTVELCTPQRNGLNPLTSFWCEFDPEIGTLNWIRGGAGGGEGANQASELIDYNMVELALARVVELWAKRQAGELPTYFTCQIS